MGKKHRQSKLTARKKAFKAERGSRAAPQGGRPNGQDVYQPGISKRDSTPKNTKRRKHGGHAKVVGNAGPLPHPEDSLSSSDEEKETITTPLGPHGRNAAANALYQADQRILLVGEGDFSFSRALTAVLGSGSNIIATAYDSRQLLLEKYDDAGAIIAEVERQGAKVLYEIDATRLAPCLHVGKKRGKGVSDRPFDRIVFNFPHVGLGIKDEAVNIQRNANLLLLFFQSAAPLLASNGQIHVTLKRGKPYDQWGLLSSAHSTGRLKALGSKPFRPAIYPEYRHRRTLGYVEGLSAAGNEEIEGKARTFVFQSNC